MTTEAVYFCPKCGGASIDISTLTDEAKCKTCTWVGKSDELLLSAVEHSFASGDEATFWFARDIKMIVAQSMAQPLLRMLLKWGFIETLDDRARILRYMTAVAAGVAKGLMEMRQEIEKERVREASHGN